MLVYTFLFYIPTNFVPACLPLFSHHNFRSKTTCDVAKIPFRNWAPSFSSSEISFWNALFPMRFSSFYFQTASLPPGYYFLPFCVNQVVAQIFFFKKEWEIMGWKWLFSVRETERRKQPFLKRGKEGKSSFDRFPHGLTKSRGPF